MFGISLDLGRLLKDQWELYVKDRDSEREMHAKEVAYLRSEISRLQDVLFRHLGLENANPPKDAALQGDLRNTRAIRGWPAQKDMLERKFSVRPPELEERERVWKAKAKQAAEELMGEGVQGLPAEQSESLKKDA